MKSNEIMEQWARSYLSSKSDFERERYRLGAYQAAVGLSGSVGRSTIKREMEKLRLIKVYEQTVKEAGETK